MYGQFLGRDFNPLAKLLLLRTPDPIEMKFFYSLNVQIEGLPTSGQSRSNAEFDDNCDVKTPCVFFDHKKVTSNPPVGKALKKSQL